MLPKQPPNWGRGAGRNVEDQLVLPIIHRGGIYLLSLAPMAAACAECPYPCFADEEVEAPNAWRCLSTGRESIHLGPQPL